MPYRPNIISIKTVKNTQNLLKIWTPFIEVIIIIIWSMQFWRKGWKSFQNWKLKFWNTEIVFTKNFLMKTSRLNYRLSLIIINVVLKAHLLKVSNIWQILKRLSWFVEQTCAEIQAVFMFIRKLIKQSKQRITKWIKRNYST